ncbi:MAG: FAD-dependent oxidoreductase [Gemmatimonadota bacterium]
MAPIQHPRICIVGAGLGGSLMACYLGRAGHTAEIFEARPDPRPRGFTGGRSINLALSTRGVRALREVGLAKRILADSVPMRGRMIHSLNGRLTFQPYGTAAEHVIHSVSRAGLNLTLLEAASGYPNISLSFGWRCVGVDPSSPAVHLRRATTGHQRTVEGDLIIGADGAFSAVRGQMQRLDRFDYSQDYLTHGYKELTIPPGPDGSFLMEREALHIWPRGGFMLIALPNADGSYTCTLFLPFVGANSFAEIDAGEGVKRFFERHFPDVLPLVPTLEEDYRRNPVGSLVTVRCAPWTCGGKVVLLGDAAHAVVPFYGQGMNASFEDCSVLSEALERCAPDWAAAVEEYYEQRKPNTDALAELALGNFVEMRDRVASSRFLLAKRLGRALHTLLPNRFVPLYTMVTFTSMPYAEAVRRARRQVRTVAAAVVLAAVVTVAAALAL